MGHRASSDEHERHAGRTTQQTHHDQALKVAHIAAAAVTSNATAKDLRRQGHEGYPALGREGEGSVQDSWQSERARANSGSVACETACAYPAVVVELLDAALAGGAVVYFAIVRAPDEATDAIHATILVHIPDPVQALTVAQPLRDDLGHREARLGRPLHGPGIAPHEADEARYCNSRFRPDGEEPHLDEECEVILVGLCISLQRSNEQEDEEQHEAVAAACFSTHRAVVRNR